MSARTHPDPPPAAEVVPAFSYLRYSSPIQGNGDSMRRQEALRQAWLERNPQARFDATLVFEDRGITGFTGQHRANPDRHALAAFLDLVHNDKDRTRVPRGSYLLIENLDRLTREDIQPALMLFLGLTQAGIRVVQLSPVEQVYDKDSPPMVIMQAIMELSRGNAESRRRASILGPVWREKKRAARTGKPHGHKCPAWVELDPKTNRYKPRPAAVKALRAAFRLVADENLALSEVCNRLTAAGHKPIGYSKKWGPGYLALLLTSRTVLGEYQPMKRQGNKRVADGEAIPDYYPRAISDDLFARVQATRETGTKGGRRPRSAYPLAGLVVDARDGSKMYVKEGDRHPSGPYFVSRSAVERRPGAVFSAFPVHYLTDALLSQLVELREDELFADPSGSKIAELTRTLHGIEKLLTVATERHEADPESPTWADQMTKHDRTRRRVLAELAAARREAASPLPEAWVEAVALMTRDEPGRLSAALRRCVAEVRLLVVEQGKFGPKPAVAQVRFKGGATRSYVIVWHRRHWSTPAAGHIPWGVRSFAGIGNDVLDLRDPEHVRRLEAAFASTTRDDLEDLLEQASYRADARGDNATATWISIVMIGGQFTAAAGPERKADDEWK